MKSYKKNTFSKVLAILIFCFTLTLSAQLKPKFSAAKGPTRLSGSPASNTVGAKYIYQNVVVNQDGITVDAVVTIVNISHANIGETDESTYGSDNRFQPTTSITQGGGYVEWEINFVADGTVTNASDIGTPVVLNNFSVEAIDVDGREFFSAVVAKSYVLEGGNNSLLTVSQPHAPFTRFQSPSGSINGISTNPRAVVRIDYENVSTIRFRNGDATTSSYARLHSVSFLKEINFSNPQTTTLNTAPTVVDNLGNTINIGTTFSGNILTGANDVDGNIDLTTVKLIDPNNTANQGKVGSPLVISNVGTYTVTNNGSFVFTPIVTFAGDASIKFTVEDTLGLHAENGTLGILVIDNDNDNDGIGDTIDLDDDNDGILDTVENNGTNPILDANNNGVIDYKDPATPGFIDTNSDNIDDRFDIDKDGKIDQFDTDSDGDGCPDVRESLHVESTVKAGEVQGTGYSSNGKVKGFTTAYTGTNANVVTAGVAEAITAQPTDKTIISGANTSFTVATTGNVFQWEVSSDNGTSFHTILNNGVYSGVHTNTLNITGVTVSQNNYLFRLRVSKTDYVCEVISNQAKLTVSSNNPPVANSSAITVAEESKNTALGLTAPSDPDGNTLTITVTGLPTLGVVKKANGTVVANGATLTSAELVGLIYDAPTAYNGTDNPGDFTYSVSDGIAPAVSGATDITITAVNDAPVAVADSGTAAEDNPVNIATINVNDTDEDGTVDPSTIILIDPTDATNTGKTGTPLIIAGKGTYTIDASGNLVFTPEANFNGTANIKYTIKDDAGFTSNEAPLNITVTPVNDNPIANPDTNATTQNVTLNVNAAHGVLKNDSDVESSSLTVLTFVITGDGATYNANQTVTIAGVGTLKINANGSYVFVPNNGYAGLIPVVTYTVSDGTGGTASSTLTITIKVDSDSDGIPDVIDLDDDNDGILDTQETPGNVNPDADSDTDGTPDYKDPDYGTLNASGIVSTFDRDSDGKPDHQDTDSDNDGCPDVKEAGHTESTTKPGEVNGTGIGVDGKVTGFATAYTGTNINVTTAGTAVVVSSQPTNKTVFVGASTTFEATSTGSVFQWQQSTDNGATFTNIANGGKYAGATTKKLTVSNIAITENNYLYRVVISKADYVCSTISDAGKLSVNNTPPVALDDLGNSTPEDTPITIPTIAGNDTDSDGAIVPSTIILIDPNNPANTGKSGTPLVIAGKGTYTVDPQGNVVFTPIANFNGTADIKYTVKDTRNITSNEGTVGISVSVVNDAPIANNVSGTINEGDVLTLNTITSNDTDVDGTIDTTSIILIDPNNPANVGMTGNPLVIANVGTYTVTGSGTLVFTPVANYYGNPNINYTVKDNLGLISNTAIINITVNAVNDAPIANPDTATTPEDVTLNITTVDGLLKNDTDVDGNTMIVTKFVVEGVSVTVDPNIGGKRTIANKGELTIRRDGSFAFVPVLNFHGTIPQVMYTVSDGVNTATSTLDITVSDVDDAPIANPDANTTNEDVILNVSASNGVLKNDTDIDVGTTLVVSSFIIDGIAGTTNANGTVTIPNVGTLKLSANGSYTYTPFANFNGNVPQVTYTISDGILTATSTLDITVIQVNDAPIALPDTNTTNENTTLTVAEVDGLLKNDNDPDGHGINIIQFVVEGVVVDVPVDDPAGASTLIPGKGTLTITRNGSYTFVPVTNFNGKVPQIHYTITDDVNTANATLDITVNAVNDAPIANPDTNVTNEDITLTVSALNGVLKNDTDVDEGTTLNIVSFAINGIAGTTNAGTTATIPTIGTLKMNADGSYVFSPALNYNGAVPQVTYTVSDGTLTASSTFDITVNPIDDAPVANPDTNSVNEDTTLTVLAANGLLTNDTDIENDPLTVRKFVVNGTTVPVNATTGGTTTIPGKGDLTIKADGSYTFVPVANFNGAVPQIVYTISDGSKTANNTLELTVNPINDAPIATNDVAGTDPGVAVKIPVLSNDTDIDGDVLTVSNITVAPTRGTAVINADGTITYTPNAGVTNGTDTFTYEISDGNGNNITAVVNISIPVSPFPPVANADTNSVDEDTTLTVTEANGVLKNDTDGNLDHLTLVSFIIDGAAGTNNAGDLVAIPNVGNIKLNFDGSYVFTPVPNFNGNVPDITYTITDGTATANASTTLKITVNPVNDHPVLVADVNSTTENTPLNVAAANGVLANDTDIDGDAEHVTQFAINGTTYLVGTTANITKGSIHINADGGYVFTPATNFNGAFPQVTYTMTDGTDILSSTLDITVGAVNDAPVAVKDTNSTNEDTLLTVVASNGILKNDSDVDGDAITVSAISIGGTVRTVGTDINLTEGVLNLKTDGSYTFTPTHDFNGNVPQVTYTISDGNLTASSTLDITVIPVNDAPLAVADFGATNEDVVLTVSAENGILSNDSDVDGNSLTVTKTITQVSIGTTTYNAGETAHLTEGNLVVNSDGSYTFYPAFHFHGNVPQVHYVVSDGELTSSSTLDITVNAVNDGPTAVPDTNSTNEDTILNVVAANGVLKNDTDEENLPLSVTKFQINGTDTNAGTTATITEGTVKLNADGSYVYTPASHFHGNVPQITYTVTDGDKTASSTLDITVIEVNDVPVAVADTNSTNEDTPLNVLAADGVLKNDSDPENHALNVLNFEVNGIPYNAGATATLTEGTVRINQDGSYVYTPALHFKGTVPVITYTISDQVHTAHSTLTITVDNVNDVPIAYADTNSTNEDTILNIDVANGVLKNDSDSDGDTITVTKFQINGTDFNAGTTATITEGTIKINADGSYVYTPASHFVGTVPQVMYTISDGVLTATATLDITVSNINDTPTIIADTNTTLEDTPLTVSAANGVLNNDTDLDGDVITVSQFTINGTNYLAGTSATIASGVVKLNADGSYTYTPTLNYNGTVPTITYTVTDGTNTAHTTLTITVTSVDDNPVAVDDTAATDPNTPKDIPVLTNDTDIDGDVLSVSAITIQPTKGAAVINANGTIKYTPGAGFNNGSDIFTYQVSDGQGGFDTAVVTVVVPKSSFAPIANPDTNITDEEVTLTVADGDAKSIIKNDTDANLDPITVVNFTIGGVTKIAGQTTVVTEGSITVNVNGGYVFIPTPNFNGKVPEIQYEISDGTVSANATSTLNITVNPANDAPIANTDSKTINEDEVLTVSATDGLLMNDTDIDGDVLSVKEFKIGITTYQKGEVAHLTQGNLLILADGGYTFTPTKDCYSYLLLYFL
ncbi:tandem-95 repeat protein [Polaribacter pectinis]|uniref:Tandem-95 repeat protein n=1 Tax=Polaribacter pectinis TaxID=2738844 RepID=A0A7G9L7A9_9FLAO|nr:Ig-like domain-containing protein [Polaribacter pectinis]QNM84508.1 tandem-95 repeat protein [Polaribacter pectinis]